MGHRQVPAKKQKTRKAQKRVRRTRKVGGAGNTETLHFRYTVNPERILWTEHIYPIAADIIEIPGKIPWFEYVYRGPTTVEITMPPSAASPIYEEALAEVNAAEAVEKVATATAATNSSEPAFTMENKKRQYEESFHARELEVEAHCAPIPFYIFGGAACEIYNQRFQKEGGPDLHKPVARQTVLPEEPGKNKKGNPILLPAVDPTGDLDIRMVSLEINLTQRLEPAEEEAMKTVPMKNFVTEKLNALYEDYTRWIFDHVVAGLRPLSEKMSGPHFYPKTKEGNSEMANVDLETYVGNILVTRAYVKNMVKIQCGVGIRGEKQIVGANGRIKYEPAEIADHFCEFVFTGGDFFLEDNHYSPALYDVLKLEGVPYSGSPPIWVEGPIRLANHQAHGFNDRVHMIHRANFKEVQHKLYNHYARILFALRLAIFMKEKGYDFFLPKGRGFELIISDLMTALESGNMNVEGIQPCFGGCDKRLVSALLSKIME